MSTISRQWRRIFLAGAIVGSICLFGCGKSTPALYATLTLKSDGSHFAGTVVRREPNSITVTSPAGDTHTFLYSELADIKYGVPDTAPANNAPTADTSSTKYGTAALGAAGSPKAMTQIPAEGYVFPEGTVFPVRTRSFLDSCCIPAQGIELGGIDADMKNAAGKVIIPEGANVTMILIAEEIVDGRLVMTFELGTADFGGLHYLLAATKGGLTPGVRATLTCAKDGSQEAKASGTSVHLSSRSLMNYKAVTPVVLRPSQ